MRLDIKTAALVIVYHPEDCTIANIKSYYDFVDRVYVFDNTETKHSAFEEKLKHLSKVRFFHDGQNDGIASRLNSGCVKAIKDGYNWLLTMDQDSFFAEEAIRYYTQCLHELSGKEYTAAIGPLFGREHHASYPVCRAEKVDTIITSGSFLNLSLFPEIGGFDENLFIDSVDHEYCIRAKLSGYQILQFTNIHILHNIGTIVNRGSFKSCFLVKKKKQIHSAKRCYYIYRNMLYLEEKYKHTHPAYAAVIRQKTLSYLKINFFYGRNSWQLLKYLLAAFRDYKNKRMGKLAGA